ncbi:LAFE_0H13806g1_1 [Lachancea fermentati]|uniref:LAFE_0H13806g1_1 n=1 Tax=Lachancea fermentati TaxID=4955 RepID=A0A1G4MKP6_LACFM|nr:LAFE_0H13806g1_1 [Lachancea fermentati]
MSNSRFSQIENNNNERLDELANKLATFRSVNQEIGNDARSDGSIIDEIQNSFGSMALNIRNSSGRLTRSLNAGNNIWRMVGLALLLFFIIYTLFKLF